MNHYNDKTKIDLFAEALGANDVGTPQVDLECPNLFILSEPYTELQLNELANRIQGFLKEDITLYTYLGDNGATGIIVESTDIERVNPDDIQRLAYVVSEMQRDMRFCNDVGAGLICRREVIGEGRSRHASVMTFNRDTMLDDKDVQAIIEELSEPLGQMTKGMVAGSINLEQGDKPCLIILQPVMEEIIQDPHYRGQFQAAVQHMYEVRQKKSDQAKQDLLEIYVNMSQKGSFSRGCDN